MSKNLTRDLFLQAVWALIQSANCLAMDAIVEVAEKHGLDMETVARIITYNAPLKSLVESQARDLNQLKPVKNAVV